MATLSTTQYMTLLELGNRTDPKGQLAKIAEIASTKVEVLQYLKWVEGNGKDVHKFNQRMTLPTGTWGAANKGLTGQASRTRVISEPISILHENSYIDNTILMRTRDKEAFRFTEDVAFKSGMIAEVASKMIYGNRGIDPDVINGLAVRSDWDALADAQVVNGGAGSNCMSVWVFSTNPDDGLFLIRPEGEPSTVIDQQDMGRVLKYDSATSGDIWMWTTYHMINIGMGIMDPRNVVRIANLATSGTSNVLTGSLLMDALGKLQTTRDVIIMGNSLAWTQLMKDAQNRTNVHYEPDSPYGRRLIRDYIGIPFVINDALLKTESAVA